MVTHRTQELRGAELYLLPRNQPVKHNAVAVYELSFICSSCTLDPNVQYIKTLPVCKVTLHVPKVLHFSAFHSIRTTCIIKKEGTLEELLACLDRLNHLIDIMHDELLTHE